MDVIDLQGLARMVGKSNGYLSVNRATDKLEVKGSTFIGKMVVWVRFKFNRNYREATSLAKNKIMNSLLSDKIYKKNFERRINSSDPQGRVFYENKLLSARAVRTFIRGVQEEKDVEIARAKNWIDWFGGRAETAMSDEHFKARTTNQCDAKIRGERGLAVDDLDLSDFKEQVNELALSDSEAVADIKNEQDAEAYVDKAMSCVLDRCVAAARLKLQDNLRQQLAETGLSDTLRPQIEAEIADTTIVTTAELAARVNEVIVAHIGDEFDGLFAQAQRDSGCDEKFKQPGEVKEQLQLQIARQNEGRMLSVSAAHKQATQLLHKWLQAKKEAFASIQSSPFSSVDSLLKKLVLQDPYAGKAQIEAMQRDVEQVLEKIYADNSAAYEELGMTKGKFLSKIQQFYRSDLLYYRLKDLLNRSPKPTSLFATDNHSAAGVQAEVQDYVKTTTEPLVKSYEKASALKGKIPEPIYKTIMARITNGDVWDHEFISAANELHIDSLTDNDNQGLYKLLQTTASRAAKNRQQRRLRIFYIQRFTRNRCAPRQ